MADDEGWARPRGRRKRNAPRDPEAPPKRTDNRISAESAREMQASEFGGKIAGLRKALTGGVVADYLSSGWEFATVLRGGAQDAAEYTGYDTRLFPIPGNGYGDVIVLKWKKT
jgi:hypothetical protein